MDNKGVGHTNPANISQPPNSDDAGSVDQKAGKTDKGQKVSKSSTRKAPLSERSKRLGKCGKIGKKTLAKRETKSNESARPAKGLRNESMNDDQRRAIADGIPGTYAGTEGLLVDEAIKQDAAYRAAVEDANALLAAQAPLKESDQHLQTIKESAQAGIVKDEIEAIFDSTQQSFDKAADLQESLGAQKDSVMETLAEKDGLLTTAQESQTQISEQIADGTSQVSQLQTEVANQISLIEEQNKIIAEHGDALEETENALAEARTYLDAANTGVEDGHNDAANEAFDRLTALVEHHKEALAGAESELVGLDRDLENSLAELDSLQQELEQLQNLLAETEKNISSLVGETTELQEQLDTLTESYGEISAEISSLENQISQLNDFIGWADDYAEAGDLGTVENLLVSARFVTEEITAEEANDLIANGAAEVSAGAGEYITNLLDPVSAGVDVGVGLVAHSITFGLKTYKLSRLLGRKKAFAKCGDVIKRWSASDRSVNERASVQDLKDYALVAKLSDDCTVDRTDPLRSVLGDSKCHFNHDGKMSKLADNLIKIAGKNTRSESRGIPKDLRGKTIAEQLEKWKVEFEKKGEEFTTGQKENRSRSEDGKKLLKYGHQSKKLMKQFNAIVKPLGVEMEYKSSKFKRGQSSLATQHQFKVDKKMLHAHLTKANLLPTVEKVRGEVMVHKDDAPILEAFANYEQRKIDHQISQMKWTGAAFATAGIPVLKIDYGVRAGREFSEAKFRTENNELLDSKLAKIADFAHQQMIAKEQSILNDKQIEDLKKLRSEVENISKQTGSEISLQLRRDRLGEYSTSLTDVLLLAADVIQAKKDRTQVKKGSAIAQGTIDTVGATAGSAAAVFAPGVGSLAADVAVGAAKLTAAGVSIGARSHVDKKNQMSGRIETQVYSELKQAYNNSKSSVEKGDLLELTKSLFDINEGQAKMLFKQSVDRDLVSEKGKIRLRFTNTPVGES